MSNQRPLTTEQAFDISSAARALAHPTKVEILSRMIHLGDASPSQISELVGETGASLGTISYHARELLRIGTIELSHTTPRRGALEHHYKLSKQGRSDLRLLVKSVQNLLGN